MPSASVLANQRVVMACDCRLDLVMSVLVTEIVADSHRAFNRFDVLLYALRSYAPLPFQHVHLYIELDAPLEERFAELRLAAAQLFGSRLVTLQPHRLMSSASWREAVQTTRTPPSSIGGDDSDTRMVWLLRRPDLIFVDANADVLCEGLARLRADRSQYASLAMSRWSASLRLAAKVDPPVQRGAFIVGRAALADSLELMSHRMILRHVVRDAAWKGGIPNSANPSTAAWFAGDATTPLGALPTIQTVYVPLRELCRAFDGYVAEGITHAIVPPLSLPPDANSRSLPSDTASLAAMLDPPLILPMRVGSASAHALPKHLLTKVRSLYIAAGRRHQMRVRFCGNATAATSAVYTIPGRESTCDAVREWRVAGSGAGSSTGSSAGSRAGSGNGSSDATSATCGSLMDALVVAELISDSEAGRRVAAMHAACAPCAAGQHTLTPFVHRRVDGASNGGSASDGGKHATPASLLNGASVKMALEHPSLVGWAMGVDPLESMMLPGWTPTPKVERVSPAAGSDVRHLPLDDDDEAMGRFGRLSKRWLAASVESSCGRSTHDGAVGDCENGDKGSFGLPHKVGAAGERRPHSPWTWPAAVRACLRRCETCARCQYISVSPTGFACDWQYHCDLERLDRSVGQARDPSVRSGAWPDDAGWQAAAPKPRCHDLLPSAAGVLHSPPARRREKEPRLKRARASRHERALRETAVSMLDIDDVRCSERYATLLACAGKVFFFTRHDLGDHTKMETFVRIAQTTRPDDEDQSVSTPSAPMGPDAFCATAHDAHFSHAHVGLPHKLLMSHNVAFMCLHDRMLVAYGGMAHTPQQDDWQGNDVGIVRSVADPHHWPLVWSPPQLAISGDPPSTGCVDENAETLLCEYDGKLAVVHFRGSVLLYTRSNLSPLGGARHVQVATSADGVRRWSTFVQLTLEGYSHGPGDAENNIYYWTVRVLPAHPDVLVAFFPAVIEHVGGIYMASSSDGVHWTRPTRLLHSPHDLHFRTRDYPVDGQVEAYDGGGDGVLLLTVQHRQDMRVELVDDSGCPNRPHFCVYRLNASAVLAASRAHTTVHNAEGHEGLAVATQGAHAGLAASRASPLSLASRIWSSVSGVLRPIFLKSTPRADAVRVREVRAYLSSGDWLARGQTR